MRRIIATLTSVVVLTLSTACASGGGAQIEIPVEIMGDWALDESLSSRPFEDPMIVANTSVAGAPGESAEMQRAAFEILLERPTELTLRTDGDRLVYAPVPGDALDLSVDGKTTTRLVNKQAVRTRVFRDDGGFGLEHAIGIIRVREALAVVGGRLEVTRTLRLTGTTIPHIVLKYNAS